MVILSILNDIIEYDCSILYHFLCTAKEMTFLIYKLKYLYLENNTTMNNNDLIKISNIKQLILKSNNIITDEGLQYLNNIEILYIN
jgi:hypothetical protein